MYVCIYCTGKLAIACSRCINIGKLDIKVTKYYSYKKSTRVHRLYHRTEYGAWYMYLRLFKYSVSVGYYK